MVSQAWPEAFIGQAAGAAVLTDFDGTLSAIVAEPAAARPLPGALPVLYQLAERLAVVGVVSGRPASFLVEQLAAGRGPLPSGLRLAGLYGLELVGADGLVRTVPEAERWRPALDRLASAARASSPPGVYVEHKGLAVTLHWRQAPTVGPGWATRFIEGHVQPTGLVTARGRKSVELLPPAVGDKGAVVRTWAEGCQAAAYLGDDRGDLPAFKALEELARAGRTVWKVAVVGPEVPVELAEAADVVVDGPQGALRLLAALRDRLAAAGPGDREAGGSPM